MESRQAGWHADLCLPACVALPPTPDLCYRLALPPPPSPAYLMCCLNMASPSCSAGEDAPGDTWAGAHTQVRMLQGTPGQVHTHR